MVTSLPLCTTTVFVRLFIYTNPYLDSLMVAVDMSKGQFFGSPDKVQAILAPDQVNNHVQIDDYPADR